MKGTESPTKEGVILPNFDLAELRSFPLTALLTADNQDLAKLMLTFSLAYNDFKDYMWLRQMLGDALKTVDTTKKTKTLGQLNGMSEHCTRMLIAHLLELLETIRECKSVYDCCEFKKILYYLGKIKRDMRDDWWTLVRLADSKDEKDAFYKTLIKIRNNGTYHYKQTNSLYQGLKYYVEKDSEVGFASMGETLEKSRFFFGDAAIQYYHKEITKELGGKFEVTLSDYSKKVNRLLRFMIEVYLVQILRIE